MYRTVEDFQKSMNAERENTAAASDAQPLMATTPPNSAALMNAEVIRSPCRRRDPSGINGTFPVSIWIEPRPTRTTPSTATAAARCEAVLRLNRLRAIQ